MPSTAAVTLLGFGPNNCGSLCVRGGHRHWARVLEVFPERYAEAERQEQELRAELGDVAILRDRTGGCQAFAPSTSKC
ncbi:hypothetical protein ACFFS2_22220 [Streptomyces aurantiacus]|uniref:Uncharacterized protein n=1 Tax=Streptomyces aurantiacus TaxID=47760 RepID=A0A7G1P5E0_9ACTN|nr:hypothetical protein [Streptomyces aurantiacus]BCL30568.1 hypothetical protein GCM10017557_54270 [Streptomyces aurantiacus]